FLFRTRPGVALRAVVDAPEVAALHGAAPARVGQMGWAIGAVLAALAGILLAPVVTLDALTLTLLVINGYAAAIVGRLRSLPLTFAGGLVLGLFTFGRGMVFAIIMLSVVLLTGYGGQVSLAQLTFVGFGAFAMGKIGGGGSVWGILVAVVLAGVVGAVAALPALRLQGLYLGLI